MAAIDPNHRLIRYMEAGRTLAVVEPQRALRVETSSRVAVVQEQ